jgi:hypothetical protein
LFGLKLPRYAALITELIGLVQPDVSVMVTQTAKTPWFLNEYMSYRRGPEPNVPGQGLVTPHLLGLLLGNRLAVCWRSPAARLPLIVVVGQTHEGSVNGIVLVPPVNVTASVKLIVVPHAKLGEVFTLNGTMFVEAPFSGVSG